MERLLAEEKKRVAQKLEEINKGQTDLADKQAAKDEEMKQRRRSETHSVIWVKATTEIGDAGISGAIFQNKINSALPGRLTFQGAHYRSLTSGLAFIKDGSDTGAMNLVNAIRDVIKSSPSKKIFLCGK
jgi:hypothetical protein